MGKEKLKTRTKEEQNSLCDLSKEHLPEDVSLFDTHRDTPKRKGGIYTNENTRVVIPIEHMKHHGSFRSRNELEKEFKALIDDRNQILKLRNKINNQILAYKRNTDQLNQITISFLEKRSTEFEEVLKNRDNLVSKKVLEMKKVIPIISAALSVKGVGPLTVADCYVYLDLTKARHASSLWKYVGLHAPSHKRYTKGEAGGGNKTLRTRLYIFATGQIMQNGPYRPIYDQTKTRLEKSDRIVETRNTKGVLVKLPWKETKPCHRNGAGIRNIIKHFLADYWWVGRTILGLPTSPLYPEAMLSGNHRTIMPEERGWVY